MPRGMRVRLIALGSLAAFALAAAGCGGGGGGKGSVPNGASAAPASAPSFVSLNTDFTSDQWKRAQALIARFPGAQKVLQQLTKQTGGLDLFHDILPALGPEVDVVVLDFKSGGNDVVGLAKPKDKAKFDAMIEKGNSTGSKLVTREVGGWEVLADSNAKIDAYEQAVSSGKLSDSKAFKDAIGRVPADALARVYVAGAPVTSALETSLEKSGAAPGVTNDFGTLDSAVVSAKAEDKGIRLDGDVAAKLVSPPDEYSAGLTSDLPSGALLYVSFDQLDRQVRQILKAVGEARPSFNQQLSQVESLLGISLEKDVLPIVSGEGAIAIYPSSGQGLPAIELVLKESDAAKARKLLDRVGAIAGLGGGLTVKKVRVSGVEVDELSLPVLGGLSIYYGVFDGKLVVTNSQAAISALRSGGQKLADDPVFKRISNEAGMPGKTVGFAYVNLASGLPALFGIAGSLGQSIAPTVIENTKPLQAALVYATRSGDHYPLGGFLEIK
jgi:Protein of unknown function (DUF3352)